MEEEVKTGVCRADDTRNTSNRKIVFTIHFK